MVIEGDGCTWSEIGNVGADLGRKQDMNEVALKKMKGYKRRAGLKYQEGREEEGPDVSGDDAVGE